MAKNAQCVQCSDGEIRWRLKSQRFAYKIAYVSAVFGELVSRITNDIMSILSFKNKDLGKFKKKIIVFIILFCGIFVQFS